jgi:hypothetical protein
MKKIDITDFSGGINLRFAPEDFKPNENFQLTGLLITNENTLRSQPPCQVIGTEFDFKEIKPLVNSDGTAYVIGIKDNGQVFYTLVPSAGAIYSATSSQAWTRITAINGSATLTVTTNHHIISNFAFTTPPPIPVQTVPALLITNAYDTFSPADNPIIIFAYPGSQPFAYRVLTSGGTSAIYPGYLPTNPTNITSSHAGVTVTVNWNAPTDSGSSAITNYKVYDKNGVLKATVGPTTFTASYTGVLGDEVGVRVKAVSSYGETPFDVLGNVRVPSLGYIPRANVGVFWNGYLVVADIEYYRDINDIGKNIPLSTTNATRVRNGIWFSMPDNPTQFDPLAQFTIGQPDSQITSMIVIPAGLLVFTKTVASESGIFLLRGSSPGVVTESELILNFSLELVRGGLGTRGFANADVSHNVAAAWSGTGSVVFQDENSLIWKTDGQSCELISENILNIQTQQSQVYDNLTTWDKWIFAGFQNRLWVGRDFGDRVAWTAFVLPPSDRSVFLLPPNGPRSMFEINNQIFFIWNDGINKRVWRYLMTPLIQGDAFFEQGKINNNLIDIVITTRPVKDADYNEKTFWHRVGLRFKTQLFTPFGTSPPTTNSNNFKIKSFKVGTNVKNFYIEPITELIEINYSPPLEFPLVSTKDLRGQKVFPAHGPSIEAMAEFTLQGTVDIEAITFYAHGRKPSRP